MIARRKGKVIEDTTPCACGHVWDEHDPKTCECTIEGCPCFYFEADLNAEEEAKP